jgi:8-oxo-dGTP diphosphatase
LKVAVGVIIDGAGQILVTRRPLEASHGGQWEFPGGKLEENESPMSALKREIREEVGLEIIDADFLTNIRHTYGLKNVELFVYCVYKFEGSARCCESQMDMRWVHLADMSSFQFPEANKKIIELLQTSKMVTT